MTLAELTYDELLARAARYLPPAVHARYSDDQERDDNGRFAGGGGGGGGGSIADDPNVGEVDEGDYGYGRDANGVSYTEFDVDQETGEPKFSQSYRDKYGPLTSDSTLETADGKTFAMATSEKGPFLHVADDSEGTQQREVIQEFSKAEAGKVGTAVYSVYSGERPTASAAGVTVRPAGGNPTRDGVVVRWSNGREDIFAGEAGDDAAFELQEGFAILSGTLRSRTHGRAILSPYPEVRARVERFLRLPDLPPAVHLRYSEDQPRDENGRFGEGGGGGGSSSSGGRTPDQFDEAVSAAAGSSEATSAAHVEPVSGDEWRAVDNYAGIGYEQGNSSLRASSGDPDQIEREDLRQMVDGLDSMMDRSSLDRDIVVRRGVTSIERTFGGQDPTAGTEWVDHGYTSTTTGMFVGDDFTGESGAAMRILVPKGTRAISTSGLDSSEVLLDRGLRFRVVRDNGLDY